ncbi:unnamed protein product, partial [Anisakis simplex]|uniref:G_PROTEIN_RECEP_F1_2 domain-containing protein n=1 Tax=Anisakis simplex TaxID=6269 RepID=A0A0M3K1N8_ANISI
FEVVGNENCTGVTEHKAVIAEWTNGEPYKTFYRFWFRNIITIFVPFILLFYFNIQIVVRLRRQHHGAKLFRFATSEHRKNIRAATRMLVLVSCTYLASNVLNVFVSAWEFVDVGSSQGLIKIFSMLTLLCPSSSCDQRYIVIQEFLLTPQWRPLYTFSSDLVSLLTVLSCACRLPIYCACNQRIRIEVISLIECVVVFTWLWCACVGSSVQYFAFTSEYKLALEIVLPDDAILQ